MTQAIDREATIGVNREDLHVEVVAEGLQFPEGPIAMSDGSVLIVEIRRRTLTRIGPSGEISVVAQLGGGPNGAAIGPDGSVYITNSGGFDWIEGPGGTMFPGELPADYAGGSIQRVDLRDGSVHTLYTECEGRKLNGANDLVFDKQGGFYFTDIGKSTPEWLHQGHLYYALADGSHIRRVRAGLMTPNGVALSPDNRILYLSETHAARLWAFDIVSPGVLAPPPDIFRTGRLVWNAPGFQMFDSIGVEESGNICVGTIVNGGITIVSPQGEAEHLSFPASLVTNICFGGPGMRTAWVTAGDTGKLFKLNWPRPGLKLNFNG